MGYYAEHVNGDPFTITRPGAVLTNLATTEGDHGHAWIHPVQQYRRIIIGTDEHVLIAVLRDFGFEAEHTDNGIRIDGWTGEKWTASVSHFFRAFSAGTDDHVTWMFRGEDGDHWALILGPDGFREADVTVTLTIKGA